MQDEGMESAPRTQPAPEPPPPPEAAPGHRFPCIWGVGFGVWDKTHLELDEMSMKMLHSLL